MRYESGDPLDEKSVKDAIAAARSDLGDKGRLVIRKSGTEPLIRVMAEGDDESQVNRVVGSVCDAVKAAV